MNKRNEAVHHDDEEEGVGEHDDRDMDAEQGRLQDRLQGRFRSDNASHYNRQNDD